MPDHVRAVLVTSLYASPESLVIGAITSGGIAVIVAAASGDPWLIVCAALIAGVAVARIVGVLRPAAVKVERPERPGAGRWEVYYRLGAFFYAGLLGLFGLLTLSRTEDGVLQLLSVTTAIGYAAGIAGRNAGRPMIALSQLCLAALPLSVGLFLEADPLKAAMGVVIMLFVLAMMDITLQTYEMILKATVSAEEKAALAERNAEIARRDDLTGVSNRTAFLEKFERQLAGSEGRGRLLSLHWLDLDRFKEVNDSLGHLAGNALLVEVASRLMAEFGAEGIVARLGGDEFAIVRAVDVEADAEPIAQRILSLVAQPVEFRGRRLHVSASVGVAVAPPGEADADTLLKNADLALYRAKEDGRNTYRVYAPEMDEKLERQRQVGAELHGALARREFSLHFQPIFDLETDEILSCEALLRWENRRLGTVSPAEFIHIAEESGLIVEIGGWVLREACRIASAWPPHVRVAVNLSPIQLQSANLLTVIMTALSESGLPAERLELEVTESVLLYDIEASLAVLNAINRMNVATTLDDFGTGYSSLSYLTKFPFQKLKIDRSFIVDLDEHPAHAAIVQTVVELATTLGMHTVAEGIETPEQLEQLRRTRCTAGQGFLLGRPMPASVVASMLAGNAARQRA
ncbi:putative bifunctional diguanylate cyclase/phosphodiesterase [Sphingomonas sp. 3-13AW]|uniref:putative bifunctional diguanylate cyclase/phosphodiesterase n=1 Tax=Sphingomonas sp. 3-13AW TaxID=3050450 RepID=UPI003BB77552